MEHENAQFSLVNEDDSESALRVMEDFVFHYRGILVKVDQYLDDVIEKAGNDFAAGYIPWQKAVHDLFIGAYLASKKIPLPNKEDFIDAVKMFSFSAAVDFLHDLCVACQIKLEKQWQEHFSKHIQQIMHAYQILLREQQRVPTARA